MLDVRSLVVLAVAVVACSSSSGGSSRGAAADECNALVDKLCDGLAPCSGTTHADCVSQANQSFKQSYGATCDGADRVGSTYDACMTDLDNYQCGVSPPNCAAVILFEQ